MVVGDSLNEFELSFLILDEGDYCISLLNINLHGNYKDTTILVKYDENFATYAAGALPEWPSGGWGGVGQADWLSNMQHGSGPETDQDK